MQQFKWKFYVKTCFIGLFIVGCGQAKYTDSTWKSLASSANNSVCEQVLGMLKAGDLVYYVQPDK